MREMQVYGDILLSSWIMVCISGVNCCILSDRRQNCNPLYRNRYIRTTQKKYSRLTALWIVFSRENGRLLKSVFLPHLQAAFFLGSSQWSNLDDSNLVVNLEFQWSKIVNYFLCSVGQFFSDSEFLVSFVFIILFSSCAMCFHIILSMF